MRAIADFGMRIAELAELYEGPICRFEYHGLERNGWIHCYLNWTILST
jgi:hypothetical protein